MSILFLFTAAASVMLLSCLLAAAKLVGLADTGWPLILLGASLPGFVVLSMAVAFALHIRRELSRPIPLSDE